MALGLLDAGRHQRPLLRHLLNLITQVAFHLLEITPIVTQNGEGQYLLDICRRRSPFCGIGWSSSHLRPDDRKQHQKGAHCGERRTKSVAPNVSIARYLLLESSFPSLSNHQDSFHRKCCFGLRDLPVLHSGHGYADDTRMVEVPRLHDRPLRPVHYGSRLGPLGRDSRDEGESSPYLGPAAINDAEFDPTKVQLLRILEQHVPSICGRLDLPECPCGCLCC